MTHEARCHRESSAWEAIVALGRGCFTSPGFFLLATILTGWVLAPGRRTVTAMICAADPEGMRAHDAYHRFVRAARWSTNALWKVLVLHMVAVPCPVGTLVIDLDDRVRGLIT